MPGLLAAAAALLVPQSADAGQVARGVVMSIEADEAYFDIAKQPGLSPNRPVRIKRAVKLKHPVSGAIVDDELLVGTATVRMVGKRMSMIELDGTLAKVVAVGDIVEVLLDAPPPRIGGPLDPKSGNQDAADKPQVLPPIPASDPETAAALATWNRTVGQTYEIRVATWKDYLRSYPKTRHRAAVVEHLALLEKQLEKSPNRLLRDDRAIAGIAHSAPTTAADGQPLPLAFAVKDPANLLGAWLHYRAEGDDSFTRVELTLEGDGYLRTNIPARDVGAPGVEYFVEMATRQGRAGSAIGSPESPKRIDVADSGALGAFTQPENRSRISLRSTYLDYATFDDRADGEMHKDTFFLFEADFLYRVRAPWLYGIRIGMGVINGEGGFADDPMSEKAGFNYGYTEFEFRTADNLALMIRGITGLGKEGLGFGGEGRIRLGPEQDSNITFAVSSLAEIGFLSELRMQWAAIRDLPLGFSVGVTDQPNNGDLGVRLSADIGYRALSWVSPTIRVSYQGRSVQHAGLGAGLGLVFDW